MKVTGKRNKMFHMEHFSLCKIKASKFFGKILRIKRIFYIESII